MDAMNRLDGKVAVVTGGSGGIGPATAQRLVAEGAYVVFEGQHRTPHVGAAAEPEFVLHSAPSGLFAKLVANKRQFIGE